MDEKLVNLPWEIQLALASGYAAYMLAYLGIREHHKPTDVTFRTIAFGLCATCVLILMPSSWGLYRTLAAITAALAGGVVWRCWLSDAVHAAAHKFDLSWSDETPSAWSRITQHNRRVFYGQITVLLDDGSCLSCNDTRLFADAPFGPCSLGPNGDVALYVTHQAEPNGPFQAVEGVRDFYHGDELTYIPAARIKKLKMRLIRRLSGSGQEEAEPETAAAEVP